jgi:hypothetical protein
VFIAMGKSIHLLVFIWVFSTLRSNLFSSDEVGLFSQLPKGDEIRVVYQSQGCFGGATLELLFKNGTNFTATISYLSGPWRTNKSLVGNVSLSEADLRGLDKLLRFYRSNPGGGCTTVDEIEITHLRQKKILAFEHFTDRSCRNEVEGMLTLSMLALKADRPDRRPMQESIPVALGTITVTIFVFALLYWGISEANHVIARKRLKGQRDPGS